MSKSELVIINFSMPKSYKDRLDKFCDKKDLNRSELIRRWIDDNIPEQ